MWPTFCAIEMRGEKDGAQPRARRPSQAKMATASYNTQCPCWGGQHNERQQERWRQRAEQVQRERRELLWKNSDDGSRKKMVEAVATAAAAVARVTAGGVVTVAGAGQ